MTDSIEVRDRVLIVPPEDWGLEQVEILARQVAEWWASGEPVTVLDPRLKVIKIKNQPQIKRFAGDPRRAKPL